MPYNANGGLILMALVSFQVRDYIHVIDLADGHIAALRKLDDPKIGMCSN